MSAASFIKGLFAGLGDGEKLQRAKELQEYNKVLRPAVNFGRMSDMFYRRAAKLKMWVPNRIDGKKVIHTRSYLDIKRRFDPDHVKARLAASTFKGVIGRRSWKQWAIYLWDPKPVKPLMEKKLRREAGIVIHQPNTPRLRFAKTRAKYIRPRQVRKAKARAEAEELALQS